MSAEVWKQKQEIAERAYDGQLLLIDPHRALLHELNGVGARIWQLCDGTRNSNEIAVALSEEFEVSPTEALQDIQIFLTELQQKGLLQREQP